MAQVGGQTDRDARRETLSAAIMDGFETPGWKWSDEDLLNEVHNIIIRAGFEGLRGIREKLIQNFAESQVVARPDTLYQLAKALRTALVHEMLASGQPGYIAADPLYTDPRFEVELRGIVDSEDLFPVRYLPRNEHPTVLVDREVAYSEVVTKECFATTQFNTVQWAVARAIGSLVERDCNSSDMMCISTKHELLYVNHDQMHLRKDLKCQPVRAQLRKNLTRLPSELRKLVFSHLLMENIDRVWDRRRLDDKESFAWYMDQILQMLNDIEFVPKFEGLCRFRYPRTPYRFTNLSELKAEFGDEVQEVLHNTLYITHYIDCPSRVGRNYFAFPAVIGDNMSHVRHLDLVVNICMPFHSTLYYPSSLYLMQHSVPKLKVWFPGLKTLELNILDRFTYYDSIQLLPKSRVGDLTTKEAQLKALISCLLVSDVDEKWFRYEQSQGTWSRDDRIPASHVETMSVNSFLTTAMHYKIRGGALEVRAVGSSLGDVIEGVDLWREQWNEHYDD